MGLDGSSFAAPIPTVLTGNRCPLHSRSMSSVPHSASSYQSMQHRGSCMLQASLATRPRRTSVRPGSSEPASCRRRPCTTAQNRLGASPSLRSTSQSPAKSHGSSLGHQCLPLDRRWRGRPTIQCISDAVGPLGGSSEAGHDGRSSEEHSMQQGQPLLQVPWTAGKIFQVAICLTISDDEAQDVGVSNSLKFPFTAGTFLYTFGFPGYLQVMFLWLLAFWALGYFALPNSLDLLGLERGDLSARGQALMHLLLDLGELGATLFILWRCLHAYQPLALGWFRARLRPLRSWLCPALLACAFFPLVDLAAARSQGWFPYDKELWGPNVLEQSLASGDMVSNAIYFVVVTICAPVWEEAIFRGFLLPSLTRYMPLTAAVAVSALSFAGAHFSLQRFLPLVLLGIIFGTLLVRTRNLLPCVLLHSLWNAYIFWQLTCRGTVVM